MASNPLAWARAASFVLAVVVTFHALPAAAQPAVQLDHFRASELASDAFAVSRPDDLGHLRYGAQLTLDHAHDPLVGQVVSASGRARTVSVVGDQLTLNLGLALGLFNRVVVFAGLPFNAVMNGSKSNALPGPDGALVSDPWLGARLRLFGNSADRFALAMQLTTTWPLADAVHAEERYSGEIGVTLHPELLGEVRAPFGIRLTVNAGARIRTQDKAEVVSALPISHELTWGAALTVPIVRSRSPQEDPFMVGMLESFGRHTLRDLGNAALNGVEGLLGAKIRPIHALYAGMAVGTGFTSGYGMPDLRLIASVGWADMPPRALREAPAPRRVTATAPRATAPAVPAPEPAPPVVAAAPAPPPPPPAPESPRSAPEPPPGVLVAAEPTPTPAAAAEPPPGVMVAAEPAPTPAVAAEPVSIAAKIPFATSSEALTPASIVALERARDALVAHPEVEVLQVEGHTDMASSEEHNYKLGFARANAVKAWLVRHGIAPERLEVVSCGESHRLSKNPLGGPVDRRVQFVNSQRGAEPRAGCRR